MGELAEVKKKAENIIIELAQPYKVTARDREDPQLKEDHLVSAFMITKAINMKWPQSMPALESRHWLLISDELFAEPRNLSLSKLEFEWLLGVVENCDYPAALTSWRWTLVKYLQELNRKQG